MKTFTYTIKDELGIHARPAGMLAKTAKGLSSEITITKGEKTVGATKLMALMGLGVKCGDTITVTVNGGDEDAALEEILALCDQVKQELDADKIEYSDSIELGIIIETPAAALISDRLAPMVDFFSVGTNDLTQYTLACDRQNPHIERFCDTHHEAILRLIKMSAQNAHEHGAWIGICEELAADTTLTETFLRMGIDALSVSPSFVLKVRDAVRKIDLSKSL